MPNQQSHRIRPVLTQGGIMRRFARVLVAVTSLLAAFPSAHTALAVGNNAVNDLAYVQHLVFNMTPSQFSSAARSRVGLQGTAGDTWFDWSTDLCSAPLVGNTGRSFNFTESCRRHDFAYRNTHLLERRYGGGGQFWNSTSRKRIDLQFLDDTKAHCASRFIFDRPSCYAWAYTFYGAVRLVAGP
jgi:hypothetical protein